MKLPDHLPEEIRKERAEILMADQQAIAFDFADSLLGYELDCLIDQESENGIAIGRLYCDAPEIDASVFVAADGLQAGQMIPVVLEDRRDYDWVAALSDND